MKKNTECWYYGKCEPVGITCNEGCPRYLQFKYQIEASNLPEEYRRPVDLIPIEKDRAKYDRLSRIKDKIVDFVQKGKNLYICSKGCGNAKTSWAVKLMLKYFDKTWENSYGVVRGLYISVPALLLELKNFDNIPKYVDYIKEADLVIWDDIAFSKLTDYDHEQLLQFIDNRVANGKSNIYTSNVTKLEDLEKLVGGRIASRIFSNSTRIEFTGGDFRNVKGFDDEEVKK